MATTARGTTRTAAKAKAAPAKATPTRKAAAAPKAATPTRTAAKAKAAAPKATPTKRTAASASAVAKATAAKAAAKAAPKAADVDAADDAAKYAWGEHTKAADYVWLSAEAQKLRIDQPQRLGMRLNKAKAELLRGIVESGKWIDGTRIHKGLRAELADVVKKYDAGTSWMVRDKRTGLPKANGYKQIADVSQEARRAVVLLHVQTSRRAQATGHAVDPTTWVAPKAADAK